MAYKTVDGRNDAPRVDSLAASAWVTREQTIQVTIDPSQIARDVDTVRVLVVPPDGGRGRSIVLPAGAFRSRPDDRYGF